MPRVRLDGGVFGTTNNPTASVAAGVWSMKELEKYQRASLWPPPGSGIVSDTYFNRTTLLLHGDGTNGANNTVFVDSSTNALTVTTNGKPYQGTFSPFSQTGWSYYFDGTGDYISTNSPGTIFQFGTNNWTVEAWIYPTSTGTSQTIYQIYGNTADLIQIQLNGTSLAPFVSFRASNQSIVTITSTTLVSLNSWNHIALVRDSSTSVKLYVNGVLGATQVIASSTTFVDTQFSGNPTIGAKTNTVGNYYTGYVSNLRVINGTAVYTGAFTPPTSPLTAISGTVSLTCQDNRIVDNSTSSFTLTKNGDTAVQPFSPFAPSAAYSNTAVSGSAYFNGSTDYIAAPTNAGFTFGTGDFTIEGWVYPLTASNGGVFQQGTSLFPTSTTNSVALQTVSAGQVWGIYAKNTNTNSTATYNLNTWYHFALVRSGTNTTLYINGTSVIAVTGDNTNYTGTYFGVGNIYGTNYINAYISNLRVLKGTAQYTSNFTPPTSPLTATSNTQLLVNFTNAGIIDSTAKNVLTTGGSGATISTTQSKFGGSSISFSGSAGGYLQLLSSNFNTIPASTDFTLECWVYTTASNRAPNVWHNVSSQKIIAFFLSSSDFNNISTIMGPFSYPGSNASVVRGTTNIVANTWTHVAFVRSGSTITVYVDGTACGTGTSSYASLPLQLIGAISTGATTPDFYFFPGYIDDLRLTIGVARYTSNFTPSTIAFLDQ